MLMGSIEHVESTLKQQDDKRLRTWIKLFEFALADKCNAHAVARQMQSVNPNNGVITAAIVLEKAPAILKLCRTILRERLS